MDGAGLRFSNATRGLFGKASTQTLEPRLYYLRVRLSRPVKMPVYDTSLADFSYRRRLEENITTPAAGTAVSNANQLTAALTTRWLDANTGFERIAGRGAALYFE